jgi:hypothetical protein
MITSTTITNYLRMAASLLLLFASNHRHHKNILVERVRPTEPKNSMKQFLKQHILLDYDKSLLLLRSSSTIQNYYTIVAATKPHAQLIKNNIDSCGH